MKTFCLLDSNVRYLYFSNKKFYSYILNELKTLNAGGRIKNLKYLPPPFMVYEMLGFGKYKASIDIDSNFLINLSKTNPGSKEEVQPLNDLFEEVYSKYRLKLESDKRFSVKQLRKRFNLQKSFVLPELRNDFDKLFSPQLSKSFNRELLKDFLSLELMISHDYKGMSLERLARFFIVSVGHFFGENRENSFYRAMVRIWRDSYRDTIVSERNKNNTFKHFTDEAICYFEKSINLGKGEDFLDSEGVQYLLMGYFDGIERQEVVMLTSDPRESFLLRVGFFKSMHEMISTLIKGFGGAIPPLKEGLIGFADFDKQKIDWVETKSIPPLLHFLDNATFSTYLKLL